MVAWDTTGNNGTNPTNNFLGTSDAQPLVIRTNNSERVRVTSDGNVGIGKTEPTPWVKLDIEGGEEPLRAGTNGYYFTVVANRGGTGDCVDIGAFHLTAGRKSLVLNGAGSGSGNVGIGTTTPSEKLEIAGGHLSLWRTGSNSTSQALIFKPHDSGPSDSLRKIWVEKFNLKFQVYGGSAEQFQFQDHNGNVHLTINGNGGNVGIGTTTPPQAKLHLYSNEPQLRLESVTHRAVVQMHKSGQPLTSGWDFGVGTAFPPNPPNNDLWFGDFAGYRLVIQKGTGNVGIGTDAPAARLSVNGDVEVTGDIRLLNADCAEDFDVAEAEDVEAGTVMVIDEQGAVKRSQQPYDKRVAGVVSGAGEYRSGIILDKQDGQAHRKSVALMGKVACKVDAQYSPIEVGDLLTTSPTPGHAMKANDPHRAFGSVIGKALRPLKGGRGIIPILATLQ